MDEEVMATFKRLKNKVALDYAATIKCELYGKEYYCDFSEVFDIDEDVLEKSLKPNKWTLLHEQIEYSILDGISYSLRKAGDVVYEEIYEDLDAFHVRYKRHENYRGKDFHSYLCRLYEREVCPDLVPNVFNILFADRETMRQFNLVIADKISELKKEDWPDYLRRDGVMKRCTYWPSWLKNALFRREQGHCASCQKDLTGLLSNEKSIAIDHIVPLNLGGVNDSTNFQILCSTCNTEKGGDKTDTSDLYSPFW
ncbi:HNH endonuclease [Vibrio vulnificus]|nr:HNH endonuclease [Vibrio vulnificus]EIF5019699.1 HNH endonuclease [Vibrio vulnificus]EIO4070072.1 HNH endonuclease [Vibrio vulnificus]ELH0905384.1 HNH endonuclease [Vibrio vulnificus]ELV8670742.1 HNH endonuclease [Vibrio vulnificus]